MRKLLVAAACLAFLAVPASADGDVACDLPDAVAILVTTGRPAVQWAPNGSRLEVRVESTEARWDVPNKTIRAIIGGEDMPLDATDDVDLAAGDCIVFEDGKVFAARRPTVALRAATTCGPVELGGRVDVCVDGVPMGATSLGGVDRAAVLDKFPDAVAFERSYPVDDPKVSLSVIGGEDVALGKDARLADVDALLKAAARFRDARDAMASHTDYAKARAALVTVETALIALDRTADVDTLRAGLVDAARRAFDTDATLFLSPGDACQGGRLRPSEPPTTCVRFLGNGTRVAPPPPDLALSGVGPAALAASVQHPELVGSLTIETPEYDLDGPPVAVSPDATYGDVLAFHAAHEAFEDALGDLDAFRVGDPDDAVLAAYASVSEARSAYAAAGERLLAPGPARDEGLARAETRTAAVFADKLAPSLSNAKTFLSLSLGGGLLAGVAASAVVVRSARETATRRAAFTSRGGQRALLVAAAFAVAGLVAVAVSLLVGDASALVRFIVGGFP